MTTTLIIAEPTATGPRIAQRPGQPWELHQAQRADVAAIKALFLRLHAFNAALDARFALSEDWEPQFEAAIHRTLHGNESICFIASETSTNLPCGFVSASLHHDSHMWQYHEWVEVEGLYVDEACRGRGLAEALLDHICAWAESVGQPVVQLYVTASNEHATHFYQHEGFRTTQEIMRKVLA